MPSLRRNTVSVLLLALALAVAAPACGGGDEERSVPPGAIAVVGEQEIPKADFDRLLEQAEKNFEAQKQEFPQAGTPEYENLKNSIVNSLVEQAEWEQKGEEMGITVSDQEVSKRLDELKEQYFQGDDAKYREELEKQGLTDEQVREEIRARILSEKIYKAVTKTAKVTDAEVEKYYETNKGQFEQPESREVRHILVKRKARAQRVYRRLRTGADFAALAKRFSIDETSARDGGKLTAAKGRTVAPFDEFVFSAETGELSEPIKTEFGWHVIEVLSAVKPKSVTPLEDVRASIRQTLLQQKQERAMRAWVEDLRKEFEGEIAYAAGYAPAQATGDGTTTSAG